MAQQPVLHADGTAKWDASDAVLAYLDANLKPGMRTLETGAGRSTVLFAKAGCEHHSVTPSGSEIAAIRASAAQEGVDTARLHFHEGFSQDVLPKLAGPEEDLDLVFIDGGHGFPVPAVDFIYTAPRLKIGGVMLIDDVDLWTGDMIVKVLKRDPAWAFEGLLNGRTACFRKTGRFVVHEWTRQPYVTAKSFWPQTRRKLVNGLKLVASGRIGAVAGKVANERQLAAAARFDA